MAEDINDIFEEEVDADGHIPQGCLDVQRLLDRFVEINHDAALDAIRLHTGQIDVGHIRQQIVDIIRNNPPLKTVPSYFHDGRENYLWYSDFYDDAGKDVFREYSKFTAPDTKITPANYATEQTKIGLPYFRELVDLVSLEKLYTETDIPASTTTNESKSEQIEAAIPVIVPEEQIPEPITDPAKPKRLTRKRSYMPNISDEQYSLLEECVNGINLFRRPVTTTELTKLLNGKPAKPLQVANQKSLTYLLDELARAGFIKKTWISIADSNKDFTSFRRGKNEERYGDGPHFITSQQFSNCRTRNNREYIEGLETIEDTIEKMQETTH